MPEQEPYNINRRYTWFILDKYYRHTQHSAINFIFIYNRLPSVLFKMLKCIIGTKSQCVDILKPYQGLQYHQAQAWKMALQHLLLETIAIEGKFIYRLVYYKARLHEFSIKRKTNLYRSIEWFCNTNHDRSEENPENIIYKKSSL